MSDRHTADQAWTKLKSVALWMSRPIVFAAKSIRDWLIYWPLGIRQSFGYTKDSKDGIQHFLALFVFIISQAVALEVSEKGSTAASNPAVIAYGSISFVTLFVFCVLMNTKNHLHKNAHAFDRQTLVVGRVLFGISTILVVTWTTLGATGNLVGRSHPSVLRVGSASAYTLKKPKQYVGAKAVNVKCMLTTGDLRGMASGGFLMICRLNQTLHRDWYVANLRAYRLRQDKNGTTTRGTELVRRVYSEDGEFDEPLTERRQATFAVDGFEPDGEYEIELRLVPRSRDAKGAASRQAKAIKEVELRKDSAITVTPILRAPTVQ